MLLRHALPLHLIRIGLILMPLSFLFFASTLTRNDGRKLGVALETFQDVPIVYVDALPLDSTIHCIGGSFGEHHEQDWLYRSCEFRNICYDLDTRDFVLFPSKEEQELKELLNKNPLVTVSTASSPSFKVALGAVDPPDSRQPADRERIEKAANDLLWFPLVRNEKDTMGYYELPESHIFVPFQESYPLTPDSLVNKDYFSVFTLLYEFGFESKKLVLLRHGRTLPACDKQCEAMFKDHLQAVVSAARLSGIDQPASSLVCAKYGVAGLGMLMTGKGPIRDVDGSWTHTHTVGRQATNRAFQRYMKAKNSAETSG